MPRRPRVFLDGTCYHVACATAGDEPVFAEPAEAGALVDAIAGVRARDGLEVLAWCVLPGRYHLVVRTGAVPLWRSMRLIQSRAVKGHHRRHGARGRLWARRYAAVPLEEGRRIEQAIAWVHARPVATGLAADPGGFRWSGHRELLGEEPPALLDVRSALAAFGALPAEARRGYLRALGACLERPWGRAEVGRLPWWSRRREEEVAAERGRLSRLAERAAPAATADEFLAAAASALGLTVGDLSARRGDRARTRAREAVALVAVESFAVRVRELADVLDRGPGVVSRWIDAAGERRQRDAAFRARCERLAVEIANGLAARRSGASTFVTGADSSFVD